MRLLTLKCFMSNAIEGGGIRVKDSEIEEEYICVDYKINKYKINIYNNNIKVKEYNIKDIKRIYELNYGEKIVLETVNQPIIFSLI